MYVVERSIRSNFCNGSLPLEIENGRYTKPVTPLDLRTCKYCADNILEDEFTFFLIHCEFYNDLCFDIYAQFKTLR